MVLPFFLSLETKDLKQGHVMQDITFNPTASL